MPSKHPLAGAIVALLLAVALPVAAQPPTPPPFYAIQDARVVVAPGEILERATVLVADGLIEAVGTDLDIPGDMLVMDGEGLTVFAGLFDGLTSLGLVEERSEGSGQGRGGDGPVIRGPEDRPSTTPWRSPATELDPSDGRIERWRDAGFTNALTTPPDGLFAGWGTVIALAGAEADDLVVEPEVAQRLNLRSSGGFRNFPGSLMGVLSYLRQVFLDAEHHARAMAIYEQDPAGLERPAYDRTLAPLLAAMEEDKPFLIPADSGPMIDRILLLADDFDLDLVVVGGAEAYRRVDELKAAGAAVLVGLEWPEEPKDRSPDAEDSFRELAHRELAPTVPARLARAGVPFAFTSGAANASDALEGVRRAVEAGLAEADALAALTTSPARIFGLDDRLGTVAAGKIANLVVATDFPWAEGAEIRAVFVDGHRFAEREDTTETAPPEVDVSGTWTLTMDTPRGSREMTAELRMDEDGEVSGELKSERGANDVEDGVVDGTRLSFKVTQTMGPRSFESTLSAEVEGDSLSGTMLAGPMSMEVSGTRTASAPGEPAEEEAGEDTPRVAADEILDTWRTFQGPVEEDDDFAITGATIHTVSGDVIDRGTVVVRDGIIRAVGTDVEVPAGVRTIDGTGRHVIPGIIDAHSHIAIEGGVNEGSLAVTAMVGTDDVVDPDDVGIYRALAGGVTAANLLHGSANPIGGRNQVIKLRWGLDAEGLKMEEAPPGIKFALGENPKRSRSSDNGRYPNTRMGVIDVIRQAFTEARGYAEEWDEYAAARSDGGRAIPPRRDLELQTLAEILAGERLVHTHSYRADEILQMLRVAEEFGFRVATLQHVLEGYKVADEIAAHGAGASTFSDWWGYKVEAYDAIPYNAALMTERGVVVSINSDSAEEMRHLNHEAAKTQRWGGLDDNQALALITLNPAKQLGIDEWVGSIDVGKQADLVVYDGDPLSVRSVVRQTYVDGVLQFDLEADRARQEAIAAMKARLAGDDGDEEDAAGDGETGAEETPQTTPDPLGLRSADLFAGSREGGYSCREELH